MAKLHKLSALAIRNASKPGLYGDGSGLYLQVSTFDTKAWVFRFMQNGRARKMGLGALHTVTLADARQRATDARRMLLDGVDPIGLRQARRAIAKLDAAKTITFRDCAEAYIKTNEAGWKNAKHADQWRATFNETRRGKKVFPAATAAINDLPAGAIDTGLVLKVLEPIWQRTPETASRIRGRIESVLDWATVREYRKGENPARWRGHLDKVLAPTAKVRKVQHHDAVPYRELPVLMAEIRAKDGISARAIEFTVLTAARTGETIGAEWAEFDLAAKTWAVPGNRMKAGREHRVPLSERAVAILEALPREGRHVFPGAKEGRALSNMAMLELLRGMRGKGATVHGLRSTFKDWASETTAYPNEMTEVALAHAVSDKTEAAYRRGDMFEKRGRLMADWAKFCEAPASSGENVVAMKARAI